MIVCAELAISMTVYVDSSKSTNRRPFFYVRLNDVLEFHETIFEEDLSHSRLLNEESASE
jgi:hypothetical protein